MAVALVPDLKPIIQNYPKRNPQLIETVKKIKLDRTFERSLSKSDLKINSPKIYLYHLTPPSALQVLQFP